MKIIAALLPLVALTACKTTQAPEPIIKTVYVNVPVTQPCVPKTLGPPPQYIDTDDKLLGAKDAAERYQLLYAGRTQRNSRLGEVEPVVRSCPKEQ
jgi:hypothetical protein